MAKKKKLKKRKISKKHELQSVEVKNVVILLVILIAIMSACTFVFYQINQEITLNKIEKDSENKIIARNLIHKNTGYTRGKRANCRAGIFNEKLLQRGDS